MNDLLENGKEAEILYQNEELIVFRQDEIKWIVNKDNEILMTIKDIGLLGGNSRKTKEYERDLRNKRFITPYNLNPTKSVYRHSIKIALTNNPKAKFPILYNYPAITQIIAELRTDKARKRNQQLGILQEEIRTKGYFIAKGKEQNVFNHLRKLRADSIHVQKILNGLFTHANDYDPSSEKIGEFYGNMQNKLYQAVSNHTSNELKYYRADHTKPHMNLTSWKGKRDITKSDVKIGKNYLKKDELDLLIKIVNMLIDFIEIKVIMKKDFGMDYIIEMFDYHLGLVTEKKVTGHGRISKEIANERVFSELGKYRSLLSEDSNVASLS